MKVYEITDMVRFRDDFRKFLPEVMLMDIKDGLMTVINKRVTIDIVQLGRELCRLYPDDWEKLSMNEVIEKHYGKQGVEFINAVS